MSEKFKEKLKSPENESEKNYGVSEFRGEKTLEFVFMDHPTPSVAKVLEIIKKEFPGVSLEELEISSGDEVFVIEKKKKEETET